VKFACFRGSFLQCRDEYRFNNRRSFFKEIWINGDGLDVAMAIDNDFDSAAAVRDFHALCRELFLHNGNAALHFLSLFEKFAYASHVLTFIDTTPESSGGES
jgi:hypothetical protein